jgi:hypothetical protein
MLDAVFACIPNSCCVHHTRTRRLPICRMWAGWHRQSFSHMRRAIFGPGETPPCTNTTAPTTPCFNVTSPSLVWNATFEVRACGQGGGPDWRVLALTYRPVWLVRAWLQECINIANQELYDLYGPAAFP